MDARQVMKELESKGTAQARKIYTRHGYAEPMFGVSYADLNALAKKIKKDDALADALWKTGNSDARILAVMVTDTAALTESKVRRLVKEANFRSLREQLGRCLANSPPAPSLAREWLASNDPGERQFGLSIAAVLAQEGKPLPTPVMRAALKRIERDIHGAENWARYSMMYGLIGIGAYDPALTDEAIAAAKRIGKVEFDPGETSCKMPDPVPYIKKTVEHLAKKKKKAA